MDDTPQDHPANYIYTAVKFSFEAINTFKSSTGLVTYFQACSLSLLQSS